MRWTAHVSHRNASGEPVGVDAYARSGTGRRRGSRTPRPGERSSISSRHDLVETMRLPSLASSTQTPRPSGSGASSSASSASLGSARGTTVSADVAAALARAEVERVVAEETSTARWSRASQRSAASRAASRRWRLAGVERGRRLPAPGDLGGDERGDEKASTAGARPPAALVMRRRPTASMSAKNGRAKMRCRVSGALAPPPTRASARPAAGTAKASRRAEALRGRLRASRTRPTRPARRRREQRGPAGDEVAERAAQVLEDGQRAAELLSAAADPEVETGREHEVRAPERHCATATTAASATRAARERGSSRGGAARPRRPPGRRARTPRTGGRRARRGRQGPEGPARAVVAGDGTQERQERERAREEEEAVHAPVDPVEERDPARGDDHGGDERGPPVGEPGEEQRRPPGRLRPRTRPRRAEGR